jgi:hypothetical protein
MRKDLFRLLVFLGGAFLLLFPMLAAQIGFESFTFEWGRLLRVMAVLAVGGLVVVACRTLRSKTLTWVLLGVIGACVLGWMLLTSFLTWGNLGRGLALLVLAGLLVRAPPRWRWGSVAALALIFPWFADNYSRDVAINVLIYVSLGLGLNIVVGLAGLLDLGYIAFYAVGAYTYALLNTHFGVPFWLALPIGCVISAGAGSFIGYPTLRMRGDYLAIVTLGFGEIIRIVLNNWDRVTEGPNGILGIKAPGIYYPAWVDGGSSASSAWTDPGSAGPGSPSGRMRPRPS